MREVFCFLTAVYLLINFFICNEVSGNEIPAPFVACKKTPVKPVIDGKLDDNCWKECIEIGNFLLVEKGISATEQTKAYLCYDENYLYIAYRCEESCLNPVLNQLDMFMAKKTERDSNIWSDDAAEIFLAPSEEPSKYYHIAVNSRGTVYDSLGMTGPKSWNADIHAAGQTENGFWTLEVAIPFKEMGVNAPEIGKYWRINLCRAQKAKSENSSWAPADNKGFHNPAIFGSVLFVEDFPAIRNIETSDEKNGNGILSADIQNFSKRGINFNAVLNCSFDAETPIVKKKSFFLEKTKELRMDYSLNPDNMCLNLKADKINNTYGARSTAIYITPGKEYEFSALVKAGNIKGQPGNLSLFYVDSYDKNGTRIKSAYDTVGVVDTSLKNWNEIKGTWKAPENASRIDFWIVKWKGAPAGDFEIDNLVFSEKGKNKNLISNGSFPKGNESAGWGSMGDAFNFRKSYGAGAETLVLSYSFFSENTCIYRSPAFRSKLGTLEYPVKSSFYYLGRGANKYFGYQINEIYIPQGETEILLLNLQSSKKDKIDKVYFTIEMPYFCRLISEFDKRQGGVLPLELKEESVERDGLAYRKYTMEFGSDAVAGSNAHIFEYMPVILVMQVLNAHGKTSLPVYYQAWLNENEKEAKERILDLKVQTPLSGKKPEKFALSFWGPPPELYFNQLSNLEKEILVSKWARSGYNYKTIFSADTAVNDLYRDKGLKLLAMLPTVHRAENFPGSLKYLRENPQYYENDANGKRSDVINLAHILDKDCPFRKVMKDVIAEYVKASPSYLIWDHEFSPVANGSAGFSEDNIKLFCKMKNIPFSAEITPQKVLKEFKNQWIDFRCWQNAEIAKIYREMIKESSPDCIFGVYSGYQDPSTKEHYGVDWKYMGKSCDNIECGYGRSSFKETLDASGKKYIEGGELVWGGYYDLNAFENTIFQRLTDCGAYMTYCDWILDGRFYKGSSRAASVASDFEEFFLNHDRHDDMVLGTDGKSRPDIAVLTHHDERLVFIFNNSKEMKQIEFKNIGLPQESIAVDYDSKKLYTDPEGISTEITPCSVKVIFIGKKDPVSQNPVIIKQNSEESTILRWEDKQGGRRKYIVQYSEDIDFKNATTEKDIPVNYFIFPEGKGKVYCRIKTVSVFDDSEGPWSDTVELKIPERQHIKSEVRKYSYTMENPSIEKWGCICDYWFTSFVRWKRDYTETRNGHKYSLKISANYDESRGYLATWDRRGPNGSKLIKVKPGEKYKCSVYIKGNGKLAKTFLSAMFVNSEGEIMNGARSEFDAPMIWEKVGIEGKVPLKSAGMFFVFGLKGAGDMWFDEFDVKTGE